ncbi:MULTISPECIES: hypothetical protein [unclassified Nocardia]|uniref:hypothetical protein n=1 Tax=unclassified Nocardia TaxID=2637762 RepID=UPI0033B0D3D8
MSRKVTDKPVGKRAARHTETITRDVERALLRGSGFGAVERGVFAGVREAHRPAVTA